MMKLTSFVFPPLLPCQNGRDVIIISSVSCIYGLGSPQEFQDMMISLRPGMNKDRDEVIRELIDIQYTSNEMDFHRSTFRVRGDTLEIYPANYSDTADPCGIFRR